MSLRAARVEARRRWGRYGTAWKTRKGLCRVGTHAPDCILCRVPLGAGRTFEEAFASAA